MVQYKESWCKRTKAHAHAADCDRDALESVLGHLVSKGVFEQPAPGTFALNDTARGLLDADWQSVHSVVDVGGGTGALLGEILRAYPHVRGTLIDLPRTIARSHDT
jgi:O-methyltransferase domain